MSGSFLLAAVLVLKGATVHTAEGPPLRSGVVVIENGKITAVGGPGTPVPPGAKVVELPGKHVAPAFFTPASNIGLVEIRGGPGDRRRDGDRGDQPGGPSRGGRELRLRGDGGLPVQRRPLRRPRPPGLRPAGRGFGRQPHGVDARGRLREVPGGARRRVARDDDRPDPRRANVRSRAGDVGGTGRYGPSARRSGKPRPGRRRRRRRGSPESPRTTRSHRWRRSFPRSRERSRS